jgi:hypothetical protein
MIVASAKPTAGSMKPETTTELRQPGFSAIFNKKERNNEGFCRKYASRIPQGVTRSLVIRILFLLRKGLFFLLYGLT